MHVQIFQDFLSLYQLIEKWLQNLNEIASSLSVCTKYMFDALLAFSHQSLRTNLQSLKF